VRTSACVDCATPIIGDRLRCPACHAGHAKPHMLSGQTLASMIFVVVFFATIVGLVLGAKGCV
jgi:hypothetical protein